MARTPRQGPFLALLASVLLTGTGCVISYLPPPALMPMADEAGDVHLAASAGFSGFHVAGSYALTDHLSAHVGAQGWQGDPDRYQHLMAGVRYFGGKAPLGEAPDAPLSPLRWSVGLTGGGGYSVDESSGSVGQSGYDIRYAGPFLRTALEADAAFESDYFGFGVQARMVYFRFWHDASSEHPGQVGWMWLAEPALVIRPGIPEFKFDLQAGLSLPIAYQPPLGLPLPLTFSVGFVVDL
ncbi:MAG: hypothetical protein D6729_01855 [Deltaproteobacteria bacterium]|nr:MAG: hypothetical protein D6729_01855 [Deltaproteobacteria bacterium]